MPIARFSCLVNRFEREQVCLVYISVDMELKRGQGLTIVDESSQELILIFICSEIYQLYRR
jgi:hypothetical protein